MDELGYSGFSYQSSGENSVYAITKQALTTEDLTKIKEAFTEIYGVEPGDNVVTPVVGRDLVRNAVILTIVAWIAMMAYVTFRYEWSLWYMTSQWFSLYSPSCASRLIPN